MKKRIALTSAVLIIVVVLMAPVAEGASSKSRSGVVWLDDFSKVPGAFSMLMRNDDGVAMRIKTRKLPVGAYTVWFVIWDLPGNCTVPFACGEIDLGNFNAGFTIAFATGHIIASKNGKLDAAAGLSKGAETFFDETFDNPHTAEIHLIVQYHGRVDPDEVHLQIQSPPGGGCNPACVDLQASVHQAP